MRMIPGGERNAVLMDCPDAEKEIPQQNDRAQASNLFMTGFWAILEILQSVSRGGYNDKKNITFLKAKTI